MEEHAPKTSDEATLASDALAKKLFILSVGGAAAFIAVVFLFVLRG